MNDFYEKSSRGTTKQFRDIFLPEMTLLSSVLKSTLMMCTCIKLLMIQLGVHIKGITYRGIEADNEKSVHSVKQTQDAPCHQPQQLRGQSIRHIIGEICATWFRGHSSDKKLSS